MPKQPFVPVAKVLRLRYAGLNQGMTWVNGFCIQYDGSSPTNLDLTNLAATLGSLWMTHWGGLLTTVTSLRLVQVWDISSDTGSFGTDSTTHNGQTSATSPLSVNSAVCLSWPVQRRWRGGHFRTYLPARTIGDISGGHQLSGAVATSYADAGKAFKNAVNAISVGFGPIRLGGVRYFPTGQNPDGTPVLKTSGEFHIYSDPVCHTRLDSQRRRLGKELA